MKTIILAAIRCSLMFTAVTASLFSVRPAQAYLVTLEQVGSNVVANGSGAINLTGLTKASTLFGGPQRERSRYRVYTDGSTIGSTFDGYFGFTGPMSFGSG